MYSEIELELLNIVADAYETMNFEKMINYLSNDCVWESQWVLEPRKGIEALKKYYFEKAKMARNNLCKCEIFKCDNMSGLGILNEQEINGEIIQSVITIRYNDENKITRIDISNSDFYYNKCILKEKRIRNN